MGQLTASRPVEDAICYRMSDAPPSRCSCLSGHDTALTRDALPPDRFIMTKIHPFAFGSKLDGVADSKVCDRLQALQFLTYDELNVGARARDETVLGLAQVRFDVAPRCYFPLSCAFPCLVTRNCLGAES